MCSLLYFTFKFYLRVFIKPLCSKKKRFKAVSRLVGIEMKLGCKLIDWRETEQPKGHDEMRNYCSWGLYGAGWRVAAGGDSF